MRFRFGLGKAEITLPKLILLGAVILGSLFLLAWLLDIQILWGGLLLLVLVVSLILFLIRKIVTRH